MLILFSELHLMLNIFNQSITATLPLVKLFEVVIEH